MSLSLQDIHEKQFHVRFRGFDIEEVDSFLELITENFSILQDDNKKMSIQIETLTKEMDRVKNQESSFRSAIISAQKIADEMRQKSEDEANKLRQQAFDEIKALKDQAHKEVTELEVRVEQLKGMQSEFEEDIRNVIARYQANLDDIPKIIEKEPVPDEVIVEETEVLALEEEDIKDTKPDFSDLYEKIDLDDDLTAVSMTLEGDEEGEIDDQADEYLAGASEANIPDLDSDLMFTLHDPLDDDEIGIDVPIRSGKDEG